MNTPTCATCKYCRPYNGRSYICAVLHEMNLYSHIYPTDTACHSYSSTTPNS